MNTYEIQTEDNTTLTFTSPKDLTTVAVIKGEGYWEVVSKTSTRSYSEGGDSWMRKIQSDFGYHYDLYFYTPRTVVSIETLEQKLIDAVAGLASTKSPAHKLDYIKTIAQITHQMKRELEARLR